MAGSPGPGITIVDGTGWGVGRKRPMDGAVATAIFSCIRETDGLARLGGEVVTEVAAAGPDSTLAGYVYERHLSATDEELSIGRSFNAWRMRSDCSRLTRSAIFL